MALKLRGIVRLPDFPQLVDQGYELSRRGLFNSRTVDFFLMTLYRFDLQVQLKYKTYFFFHFVLDV